MKRSRGLVRYTQYSSRSSFDWLKPLITCIFVLIATLIVAESHIRSLEVASSSYYKVLEENRQLYNQVQDLKGPIKIFFV